MGKIWDEFERVKVDREVKRKKRENVGFVFVVFVGYINVGKLIFFNVLVDENVEVKN